MRIWSIIRTYFDGAPVLATLVSLRRCMRTWGEIPTLQRSYSSKRSRCTDGWSE
jgi:hypothetical protein